jgi:hypothetical protein
MPNVKNMDKSLGKISPKINSKVNKSQEQFIRPNAGF